MAAPQTFRSAFNGFNREDVVHYIEYMNAKHTEELNQLRSEIAFLQEKDQSSAQDSQTLETLQAQLQEQNEAREALEALCVELEAQRDAALAQAASNAEVSALEAKVLSLQKELTAALEAKVNAETQRANLLQSRVEQELEAYRRAERTERQARERAEQVYRATNGALADATVRVDEAATQIGEMTDQVMSQLSRLQAAVEGSKQALKDAAGSLYAIRPEATEE